MRQVVPLSEDLLRTMRAAAKKAIELREPFITPRAMLLALMDDPAIGETLSAAVEKDGLLGAKHEESYGVSRVDEAAMEGEPPAMTRYDTLAFKTPDGRTSVWLSRDAYYAFLEGARSVNDRYTPKDLVLGLATQSGDLSAALAPILPNLPM